MNARAHTMAVDPGVPARRPTDRRDDDGRRIWEHRADETVYVVRCVECDTVVGDIYDYLKDRHLRLWWRPGNQTILIGGALYVDSSEYEPITRDGQIRDLIPTLRECHQVQMDALCTPMPRRRPARSARDAQDRVETCQRSAQS